MFQPAVLRVDAPCDAETRREVLVVGVVGRGSFFHLDELRRSVPDRARRKEGAGNGGSPEVVRRARRVAGVVSGEGTLHFPTQAVIERQVLSYTPRILREQSELLLVRTLEGVAQINVLPRLLVKPRVGVDGRDAAGQDGVEVAGVGQIGG